jgi:hypothetical protein
MESTESSCALRDAAARGTAWGESLMCIDTSLSINFFKKQSPAFIVKLQFNETKFQKRSALKLAGRIIPRSKLSGTMKRINNTPQLALGFIPVI